MLQGRWHVVSAVSLTSVSSSPADHGSLAWSSTHPPLSSDPGTPSLSQVSAAELLPVYIENKPSDESNSSFQLPTCTSAHVLHLLPSPVVTAPGALDSIPCATSFPLPDQTVPLAYQHTLKQTSKHTEAGPPGLLTALPTSTHPL